ncbi:MAG: DUF2341 domain-containing protein, partial [Candidatus Peregrinibacteria bacterium]
MPLNTAQTSGDQHSQPTPVGTLAVLSGFCLLSLLTVFIPSAHALLTNGQNVANPLRQKSVQQDVAWGVLAMNTDKDRYRAGEVAAVQIGVLDPAGEPDCSATLMLTVERNGRKILTRSTKDGSIETTASCGTKKSESIAPDYQTSFTVQDPGTYTLTLTASTGKGMRRRTQQLDVDGVQAGSSISLGSSSSSVAYTVIRRTGATRLYPVGLSPMTIDVEFLKDFTGEVTDSVPAGFLIDAALGGARIRTDDTAEGLTTLTWTGSWKAGEATTLSYQFDAPDISPQFFLIGPLSLTPSPATSYQLPATSPTEVFAASFFEARTWQIANDAVAWAASLNGFSTRRQLTVANSSGADLTDFPLLVKLTALTGLKSDGTDIRFATGTGMVLPYEREEFHTTSSSGSGIFWVKVPTIKNQGTGNGSGATIYLYYGSGSAVDGANRTQVWDSNFKGVWHLSGSTLSAMDSTSNANNGTNNGVTATTGIVDGAGSFNGATYIGIPDNSTLHLPGQFSVNLFIFPTGFSSNRALYATTQGDNGVGDFKILLDSSGNVRFLEEPYQVWGIIGSHALSLNAWNNVWLVRNGNNLITLYINGINSGSMTSTQNYSATYTHLIGGGESQDLYALGRIDETRISSVARSAAWIKMEYANMNNPTGTVTFAAPELRTSATTLTSSLHPSTYGSDVTFTATITPSNATGSVTFRDGTVTIGTGSVRSGSGTLRLNYLALGSHSLTARYNGNTTTSGSTSASLSQTVNASPWGLSGWTDRKAITVSKRNVSSDLSNFPLLVRVTADTDLGTIASSTGADIRFTTGTGMILPYEKEEYHVRAGSGSGIFWVKVPFVSSLQNTTVYMYYGKPGAADGQSRTAVWDSNFKGVWHLSGSTLSTMDSTSNANNGTNNGATATSGKVDGAGNFNAGSSAALSMADASSLNPDQKTLSVWVNVPSYPTSNYQHAGKITLGSNGYMLYSEAVNHKFFFFNYGNAPASVADSSAYSLNTWYYLTGVYDGSNLRIYRNGQQTNAIAVTGTSSPSTQPFQMGLYSTTGQYTNQSADEVRLSSTARSAPWIAFEYQNMASGSGELITGLQEGKIASSVALASSVNPSIYGASTILTATMTPSAATGSITFKDGATTIGKTTLGQGSGSITVSNLSAGSHSLTAIFTGSGNYVTSTSNTVTQTVQIPNLYGHVFSDEGRTPL